MYFSTDKITSRQSVHFTSCLELDSNARPKRRESGK